MLSESLQELLSAYVDGELAPAEYERVMAALRDSVVARDYVKQLREISARIKVLPKLAVPTSFSAHYLKHDHKVKRQRRAWRWGAVGAAAAALIAGVGMWLSKPPPVNPPAVPGGIDIARHTTPDTPNRPNPVLVPESSKADLTWLADLGKRAAAWSLERYDDLGTRLDSTMAWFASAAEAEAKNQASQKNLLTSRAKELGNPFRTTDVELPFLVTPEKFSLTDIQQRWDKKGLFQTDLVCTDTVKALSRLNEACKRNGVTLVLDEEVQRRLEKRLPAPFVLYLENIPEVTLVKVWSTLAELDHWQDGLTTMDASCQSIEFRPPDGDERKQFAGSLGMSPEKLVTPKASAPPASQQAIVLGLHPNRLAESISLQVRQAINGQTGPKADTVSVFFLLRSGK